MAKSLASFVGQELDKRVKALENALASAKEIRSRYRVNPGAKCLIYRVTIISAWQDQGERPCSVAVKGSLKKAIQSGIAEFKRINERSDVQGTFHGEALIPKSDERMSVIIPERYWRHLKVS